MASQSDALEENKISEENEEEAAKMNGEAEEATASTTTSSKKKKKKKKKRESEETDGNQEQSAGAAAANPSSIMKQLQQLAMKNADLGATGAQDEDAKKKLYEFWDSQPVPKLNEVIGPDTNESVEGDKTDIRKEPYTLPNGFVWDTLDLNNEKELTELYVLLNENYVEDDDNMFRFDYSSQFLMWALQPPGWKATWHCGVRVAGNKKLVGFISAVPAHLKVYKKDVNMVEINFLCVHKKLRSKRVAPVLIREITRRVNMEGIFQACYTAGIVLPKPVGTCRYWHRSLNPRKLIEVRFSHLRKNMTMQRTMKFYKLPEQTACSSIRPMCQADVPSGHRLLVEHLRTYDLSPIFSQEEFSHWFMPQNGVISSYVITDEVTGDVTDFVSYYTLPSTVVDHPKYKSLKAAYLFYMVATKADLTSLMNDALILARNDDFDVFNALNLMQNQKFLEELKFGIGDGNLNYYLYNWKCPSLEPSQIGLVLQ